MTLKADDFVVEGLTEDEQKALDEGQAEDAADVVANTNPDVAEATGEGAKAAADKAAADAKATDEKAAADKAAADKAAADKATADAKAKADADAAAAADPAKAKADADAKAAADKAAADKLAADAKVASTARNAIPDWQAPADAAAKLAEINKARDALADKFDAGELTARELLQQQRALDSQERQIERAQDRAEMAVEFTQANWLKTTVPQFLDAHAHYRDNPTLHGMLDTEVRRLQVAASEAGKDPLDPSILVEADKAIKTSLGALGVAAPAADAKTETKPAGDKQPAAAKPAIPPTLGSVPAADISGTDSKYSAIDRLADSDPVAFEDAVGRLSETERDAYLSRSH